MVRSLWTGATGMNAQQTNVDTIANNMANVNSVGYKAQGAQFKSLLYQTLQSPSTTANGNPKPTDSEVGLGVRVASINNFFRQGALLANDSPTAVAVQGNGMFAFNNESGEIRYTRNGDFTWALGNADGSELVFTTADGNPVLDTEGREIRTSNFNLTGDGQVIASRIGISKSGEFTYPDADDVPQPTGVSIGLWQFNNFGGLERTGQTSFAETEASGPALNEATNQNLRRSTFAPGYLEGSGVDVATEMVNMIVAQRAYEMNSRTITTTDSMMQTANELKR